MAHAASRHPILAQWSHRIQKLLSAADIDWSDIATHSAFHSLPTTIIPRMNWNDLIAEIPAEGSTGSSDAPIIGIEYDSRRVRPGTIFVAMKGGSSDGNKFIGKAIAAGALGIITDSPHTFDHLTVYEAGLPAL